jgi:hypothetical protein
VTCNSPVLWFPPPRYSWNIAESGVRHNKSIKSNLNYFLFIFQCLLSISVTVKDNPAIFQLYIMATSFKYCCFINYNLLNWGSESTNKGMLYDMLVYVNNVVASNVISPKFLMPRNSWILYSVYIYYILKRNGPQTHCNFHNHNYKR